MYNRWEACTGTLRIIKTYDEIAFTSTSFCRRIKKNQIHVQTVKTTDSRSASYSKSLLKNCIIWCYTLISAESFELIFFFYRFSMLTNRVAQAYWIHDDFATTSIALHLNRETSVSFFLHSFLLVPATTLLRRGDLLMVFIKPMQKIR